jgi:hypothetical protein
MIRITFNYGAPNTIYAPGCMDGSIGKTIPIRDADGALIAEGTLVAAEAVNDGAALALTLGVPDDSPLPEGLGLGGNDPIMAPLSYFLDWPR